MTGTTLVTAGTVDITREVLKFPVLEEVADDIVGVQTSDKIVIPRFGLNYGFAFFVPFLIL